MRKTIRTAAEYGTALSLASILAFAVCVVTLSTGGRAWADEASAKAKLAEAEAKYAKVKTHYDDYAGWREELVNLFVNAEIWADSYYENMTFEDQFIWDDLMDGCEWRIEPAGIRQNDAAKSLSKSSQQIESAKYAVQTKQWANAEAYATSALANATVAEDCLCDGQALYLGEMDWRLEAVYGLIQKYQAQQQ